MDMVSATHAGRSCPSISIVTWLVSLIPPPSIGSAAKSLERARTKLIAADPMDKGGVRLTNQVTIEIEGQERPACVAETMSIVYGT